MNLNLVCSPSSQQVVEKSILFNGEPHVLVVEKGLIRASSTNRCARNGGRTVQIAEEDERINFSPSARTHHTHGWLSSRFSVVGDDPAPESWRLGNWEHVDVRRYIAKRYRGQ